MTLKHPNHIVMGDLRFRPIKRMAGPIDEDFSVYKPASLVLRWYALTLDLTIFGPIDLLCHMPFARYLERLEAFGPSERFLIISSLIRLIPLVLYFALPTWLYGQTLGKRIVGLRIVRADFDPRISLWAALFRESLGKLLSVCLFGAGILMGLLSARKRSLHDYLTGTCVVEYRDSV